MLLYYMDVSQLDINRARSYVSKERVKKSDEFRYPKDKKLSIGAEILLNHVLSKIGIYNPIFGTDKYGKLFLKNDSHVHFNLSHSENYVACAVSDSPVGVDIEHIHNIDLNIAKNYFFGSEYEYIMNNNDKNRTFFKLWVLKESYMKMIGLGFRLALDEFTIVIDNEIRLLDQDNEYKWGLWNVGGGEYMLGVCSKSKAGDPELIKLQDITGGYGSKTEI